MLKAVSDQVIGGCLRKLPGCDKSDNELAFLTERPETVAIGTKELSRYGPPPSSSGISTFGNGLLKRGGIPEKRDGRAAGRIVAELERLLV